MARGFKPEVKNSRWWIALAALAVEVAFALLMLSLSQKGEMDKDGRFLNFMFFVEIPLVLIALNGFHRNSSLSAKTWRTIAIVSTIACFACCGLLPMLNYSLVEAYMLLSLGLAGISSSAIFYALTELGKR